MDKYKNNFRYQILFFSSLRKITVGGFVNQLIKKFRPNIPDRILTYADEIAEEKIKYLRGMVNIVIPCRVKPVLGDHSKIDKTKILMTNGSYIYRSKVLQNAPLGAFCNTFDLH